MASNSMSRPVISSSTKLRIAPHCTKCPTCATLVARPTSRRLSSSPSPSPSPSPPQTQNPQQQSPTQPPGQRSLLTLAIETSCDDTCVSILQTFFPRPSSPSSPSAPSAVLLFNRRRTSDHRPFGGIVPKNAIEAHTSALAPEIKTAIAFLPPYHDSPAAANSNNSRPPVVDSNGVLRQRPDFVSVTRGPGMGASLATGLNTAKGLALAWNVPLVGVHHMQAHALTPRLVNAMDRFKRSANGTKATAPNAFKINMRARGSLILGANFLVPEFPFSSLLVSGGHTTLVHSTSLTSHRIIADAESIAVGDALDKCARDILPEDELAKCPDTSYAVAMEEFAFPSSQKASSYDYRYTPLRDRKAEMEPIRSPSGYEWYITPALADTRRLSFNFSGLVGKVHDLVRKREMAGGVPVPERRELAQCTMRAAFEHIATRLVMVLQEAEPGSIYKEKRNIRVARTAEREGFEVHADDTLGLPLIKTIVVAGGVACNKYLMYILRRTLDVRGFSHVRIATPPQGLCTDNAAMIAWAGTEMYEAGYHSDPSILVNPIWPLDPTIHDGGIIEVGGWVRRQPSDARPHLDA